jgi:hypothetical protein
MSISRLGLAFSISTLLQCGSTCEPAQAQGFFRGLRDAVQDTVRGTLEVTKDAVDATVDAVDEVTDSPSSVPRASQPSTSTGHYPAQIVPDAPVNSSYADAQIAQSDPKAPPAKFKFGGYDWQSGEENAPIMGVSVPVPIPDRVQAMEGPDTGLARQEDIAVPKSLAAQISQQLHGAGTTAVIGGKRKNGFPIAGETFLKINGQEYRFRADGSWCKGCSPDATGFKAGAVILTAGKLYRLDPATMKWQYVR